MEEVTVVGEVNQGEEEEVKVMEQVKTEQEVEIVEEIAVGKEEEREVEGAVGPLGSTDFRTTKVKADRKA